MNKKNKNFLIVMSLLFFSRVSVYAMTTDGSVVSETKSPVIQAFGALSIADSPPADSPPVESSIDMASTPGGEAKKYLFKNIASQPMTGRKLYYLIENYRLGCDFTGRLPYTNNDLHRDVLLFFKEKFKDPRFKKTLEIIQQALREKHYKVFYLFFYILHKSFLSSEPIDEIIKEIDCILQKAKSLYKVRFIFALDYTGKPETGTRGIKREVNIEETNNPIMIFLEDTSKVFIEDIYRNPELVLKKIQQEAKWPTIKPKTPTLPGPGLSLWELTEENLEAIHDVMVPKMRSGCAIL